MSQAALIGVLFPIDAASIAQFDVREVGYSRIEVPSSHVVIRSEFGSKESQGAATIYLESLRQAASRVWMYVPEESRSRLPDKDHPILQSYIDICIRGCLEWGGPSFAREFLLSITAWNEFWLDDTPNSRRPWIHRKDHASIDAILQSVAHHVMFSERRHPEDYSSRHMLTMTGVWGVPNRHLRYTGRIKELADLHDKVLVSENAIVQVIGMGGVGKSSLISEYCHAHSLSTFSLIIWFRAESGSSIAADMRRFGSEFGILSVNTNRVGEATDDATIVEEIHRALMRCRSKYLLVFDNVSDPDEVVRNFLPRGQQMVVDGSSTSALRHVIFTSRVAFPLASQTLALSCFQPDESIAFLKRAVPGHCSDNLETLSELLGHLPLALAMSAAYLTSCDITVSEYIRRLTETTSALASNGLTDIQAVSASLNITFEKIELENPDASRVLSLLGYLDPDAISKHIIYFLLMSNRVPVGADALIENGDRDKAVLSLIAAVVVLSTSMLIRLCCVISAWYILQGVELSRRPTIMDTVDFSDPDFHQLEVSGKSRAETDRVWETLKKYSLLSSVDILNEHNVYGSIHRLQATAIRHRADSVTALISLRKIIWALKRCWRFDSKDISTWSIAGEILKHISSLSSHVKCLLLPMMSAAALESIPGSSILDLSLLMIGAATYLSFVLSRYKNARTLLEDSIANLRSESCTYALPCCASYRICRVLESLERAGDLNDVISSNLHELGRQLRYCGDYTKANEMLISALEMRKQSRDELSVADTLQELGVLAVRRHNLSEGKEYLLESLSIKKRHLSEGTALTSILHQLAVIATAESNYDDAERLLTECLNIETSPSTSRAATLQQMVMPIYMFVFLCNVYLGESKIAPRSCSRGQDSS